MFVWRIMYNYYALLYDHGQGERDGTRGNGNKKKVDSENRRRTEKKTHVTRNYRREGQRVR